MGCGWEGRLRVQRNIPLAEGRSDPYKGRVHVLESSRMGNAKVSGKEKLPR
jgi:hypothetical protein